MIGSNAYRSANAAGRPLVVLGQSDNKPRKRMTCVHEAAHIILPMPDDEKLEESVAYRFAGAFLLPQEVFVYEFGKFRHRIGLGELMKPTGWITQDLSVKAQSRIRARS